jgi:formimidoylglutamate deiminase
MVPGGWLSPGYLKIDEAGRIETVSGEPPPSWRDGPLERVDGYVLPGLPNVHSHAHQRGLAGRAEGRTPAADGATFWGWRERMYAFVNRLSPDAFEAIAAQVFLEMVRTGFTAVGEFHYLHNAPDGRPYADPAELSQRVVAAAAEVGIGLTLLPALYTRGGIGRPPAQEQRRFVLALDRYLDVVERLRTFAPSRPWLRIGVAPHSLRAVAADELRALVAAARSLDPEIPLHVHVAEQEREVEECLAGLGARPVRWLLDNLEVDGRWTFVHATHVDAGEIVGMAERGVVVGLCPLTEANLGDGLFPLADFHRAGGAWGVGTDANTVVGVAAELRMLDYGQRLFHRRRDILAANAEGAGYSPGRVHYEAALAGGASSLAQPVGAIVPGVRADLVVLDPESPSLVGQTTATVLDGWLVAGRGDEVRDVMVGGRWVVRDRRHDAEERIAAGFRGAMATLA